eukprot:comp23982_c0_seq1/m.42576 comp23982_c0_seq1/g.42576  ORF comp23982_c0_seq1/g.42576 comp23982_c0_seq1/m.42576 type:complete len:588 (+) comp23982_c0_seq1:346-2109(+)
MQEVADDCVDYLLQLGSHLVLVLLARDLARHLGVVLELGLSARPTHRHHGAVLKVESDHLGIRGKGQAGFKVGIVRVVADSHVTHGLKGEAAQLCGIVGADAVEDGLHNLGVVAQEVAVVGGEVAILEVQRIELAREGRALLVQVVHHLGHDGSSMHTVLVPHGGAQHEADGLLVGHQHLQALVLLKLDALVGHPLEPGQRLLKAEALCSSHGLDELGRHGGGHHGALGGRHVGVLGHVALPHPPGKQRADLVALEHMPAPIVELLGHSQTVGIGVVGKNVAGTLLLGKRNGEVQGALALLGVGELDGGEGRISLDLLLAGQEGLDAVVGKDALHKGLAHAVHGRVDNGDGPGLCDMAHAAALEGGLHVCLHAVLVGIDHLRVHSVKSGPRVEPGLEVGLDGGGNHLVVGGDDLGPVAPVHLVAVVVLGVVAGRNHHTGCRLVAAHGKGHEGGAGHAAEHVDLKAAAQEDCGRQLGKGLRAAILVLTVVVAKHNTHFLGVGNSILNGLAQTLRTLDDSEVVHTCVARTHGSAQPGRAELHALQHDLAQGGQVLGCYEVEQLLPSGLILVHAHPLSERGIDGGVAGVE